MSDKLTTYTEKYTKFVIKSLDGIKGKSESDVMNFILKDWIGDHQEELEKMGISVSVAKKKGLL